MAAPTRPSLRLWLWSTFAAACIFLCWEAGLDRNSSAGAWSPAARRFAFLVAAALGWGMALREAPLRAWVERALTAPPDGGEEAPPRAAGRWCAAGFALVCAGLAVVARIEPAYFVQDDNYAQFLPVMLHGCRSLFAGTFPEWNPHQMLGAPTAAVGTYALTYPLTWLSYAFARWGLGRERATLDVFCALHLALGYFAAFRCARLAGLRPALAAAGGASFALSGFFLTMGRTWFYMTPVALWAPLLAAAAERLRRGPVGAGWVAGTGLAIGLFFHAGNAQMWAYAVLLVGGAVALRAAATGLPRGALRRCAAAALLGLAVAAPLLVPQFLLARDIRRVGGIGTDLAGSWPTLLFPYPFFPMARVGNMGATATDVAYLREVNYSGTAFVAAWLFALSGFVATRWSRRLFADNAWTACGAVAFVLALGNHTPLWPLLSALPVFDKFQVPLKLTPYVTLCAVLGGGAALERLLRRRRRADADAAALALAVGALMLWHCAVSRASEYSYADRPYPALPEAVRARLLSSDPAAQRRLLAVSPPRSTLPGFTRSLSLNFATAYGAFSVTGFDPLVWARPESAAVYARVVDDFFAATYLGGARAAMRPDYDPLPGLRAYGARWVVVHRAAYAPVLGPGPFSLVFDVMDPAASRQLVTLTGASRLVYEDRDVALRELDGSAPLAFAAGDPGRALPVTFDAAGARVSLRASPGGALVVNVLVRPNLGAAVDGRPAPLRADAWGRAVVDVPAGARAVEVRYRSPWAKGFALSAVALAAALAASLPARARRGGGAAREGDAAPT